MAIKCHNIPDDNNSGSYEINFPYYGGGLPKEWLVWKDKLLKAICGQNISIGPQRYLFTERILTDDAKTTFNQTSLDIGICMVGNLNQVLLEMTKYASPVYAYYKQKRYLNRHLIKPWSIKLCNFITRLEELNIYLEYFPSDTEGHEIELLPTDEIMDIISHFMPAIWKHKMVEQG